MRDAGSCRIEINPVFCGEHLDLCILLQIFRRNVLNVVINREYRLRRIRDFRRANLFELGNHRAGVVMRHDMTRPNRNKIPRANHRGGRQSISVLCRDLFYKRKTHFDNGIQPVFVRPVL